MAQKTATCTIVAQRWADNNAYTEYSSGAGYAGWNSKNGYYVNLIKLSTPDFDGVSSKLSVGINVSKNSATNVTLRWALCTSDANRASYLRTASAVTDSTQVVNGTTSITGLTSSGFVHSIEISSQIVKPSTTYYLYLWAAVASTTNLVNVRELSKHSASIVYHEPYALNISAETGSSVTVNRTYSASGSTGVLASGAALYHNDQLKITFTPSSNYRIVTSTVNGSAFTSGNSHTVTGNVSIVATAEQLASGVGATDAAIEHTSTITIAKYSQNYTCTLRYEFGTASGLIAENTKDTSVAWSVPTLFYKVLTEASSGVCTISCETFDSSGKSLGVATCNMTVSVDPELCAPTIDATVEDLNEDAIKLTGDKYKLIRYKSNVLCTIGATARNNAVIKERRVNGIPVSGKEVTFEECSSTSFVFQVTDSRGLTTTQTITPDVVPYVLLTHNPVIARPSQTTGELTLSFTGNFYNGTFGQYENALLIRYRYCKEDETIEAQDWVTVSSSDYSVGSTSYFTPTPILVGEGFEYRTPYTFQIEVIDGANHGTDNQIVLSEIKKTIPVSSGIPIYDWGKNDFNFNVPVTINGNPLYAGEVLMDTPTSEAINLDVSLSDYQYLEIFFTDNNSRGEGYVKVLHPENKEVHLSLIESATYFPNIYIRHANYLLEDKQVNGVSKGTLTPEVDTAGALFFSNGSFTSDSDAYNPFIITRVVGYK